MFLTVYNNVIM